MLARVVIVGVTYALVPACISVSATAPPGMPPALHAGLGHEQTESAVTWPPNDGCADAALSQTLPVGMELDRFGLEAGSYFSPRGVSYRARSMPYACAQLDYRIYRLDKPLAVRTCHVAAWFGEPGGSVMYKTDKPASSLVEAGVLSVMSYVPGGREGPSKPCN